MYPFRSPRFLNWLYPKRTWGFSSTDNTVYLTFDDGPNPEATTWVLDFLKAEGIRATFFCVGSNVKEHPSLYQRILSEGHTVGNHTMNHENGFNTNSTTYSASVQKTNDLVQSKLFRPPYGRMTRRQEKELSAFHIIMWSWLSYDFSQKVSVDRIIRRAQKEIRSGDILVFHDNIKSLERLQVILPTIVTQIKQKRLSFAAISAT
jgi:peptidoglycan/xylan/chitin deacetylase (PgdA/CDA1 family)